MTLKNSHRFDRYTLLTLIFMVLVVVLALKFRHSKDIDLDKDDFVLVRDNCPTISNPDQADLDHDGKGDVCDEDCDGDGVFEVHGSWEFPNYACLQDSP